MKARYSILPGCPAVELAEGPSWDHERDLFYWVDIRGRRVLRTDLSGDIRSFDMPQEVGFVVPARDGGFVVGLRNGLFYYDEAGASRCLWEADYDQQRCRINDGKVDRQGRIWFGTMEDIEVNPVSHLYCYEGGTCRVVRGDVVTSNGLGWSPDSDIFYYTDSIPQKIWAYDFNPTDGTIDNQRDFVSGEGRTPDGLCVDSEGFVWGAKWGGSVLVRYAPDATIDETYEFPIERITSAAFIGPDLTTLAVTTAKTAGNNEQDAGKVLLLDTSVTGLPEVLPTLDN